MRTTTAIIVVAFCFAPELNAQPKDETKVALAKITIGNIEKAVLAYKVKTGKFPSALDDLLEGDRPFLEPKKTALLDPWGKKYQYDPAGLRNDGKKPDIWTETPDKKIICNRPDDKK